MRASRSSSLISGDTFVGCGGGLMGSGQGLDRGGMFKVSAGQGTETRTALMPMSAATMTSKVPRGNRGPALQPGEMRTETDCNFISVNVEGVPLTKRRLAN
jgi:hypothetical protein